MFGLSHDRLVHGGRAILDASNDVGRILFQSAAGIGSLGEIRDALDKEADSLWAARASKQRDYYQALDAMKEASARSKATVRTREWDAARRGGGCRSQARNRAQRLAALEARRAKARPIRRIAPQCASCGPATTRRWAELGTVPPFPHDGGRLLYRGAQNPVEDGRWR